MNFKRRDLPGGVIALRSTNCQTKSSKVLHDRARREKLLQCGCVARGYLQGYAQRRRNCPPLVCLHSRIVGEHENTDKRPRTGADRIRPQTSHGGKIRYQIILRLR